MMSDVDTLAHHFMQAWAHGVGVHARDGQLQLDGDVTALPPEVASSLLANRAEIVRGWDVLVYGLRGALCRQAERLARIGAVTPPHPSLADEAIEMVEDLTINHTDTPTEFLFDLLLRWEDLALDDQNACAWVWFHTSEYFAHSPPA